MYSQFLEKILLPLGSVFFSGNYASHLRQWQVYDAMTDEELRAIQRKHLEKMLNYARRHVPYYRQQKISEGDGLHKFPILTKEILRTQANNLISEKYPLRTLERNHSSGSSGQQSVTYMTYGHKYLLRALQTHWWRWGGYRVGEFLVQTGISPNRSFPKKLKDIFFRAHYVEAFSLSANKMENMLQHSKDKHPKHLAGYPSALNELALYALSENKRYDFNSIISYGDKMFGHYRENFKKAFHDPKIVNTYGCAEGMHMACQIDLPFYYIMSPHVFLEIVDDEGNSLPDGERGHILVTCLTNFAMPLIRYKIGDMGILLPSEKYPKTRRFQYPLLQEVTGRETEVIKTPKGEVLIVHSFTGILEYFTQIKQFKVIQVSSKELLIEFITDSHSPLPENVATEILKKLQSLVNDSMAISLRMVEHISPSPSGKPQIIEIRNRSLNGSKAE